MPSVRARRAALWVVVLGCGVGFAVLAGAGSGSDDAEISASGFGSGGDMDGRLGSANVDAEPAATTEHPEFTAAGEAGDLGAPEAVSAAWHVSDDSSGADGAAGAADDATASAEASTGLLLVRRPAAVSGCAALFHSPGEQLTLAAAGFAADTAVGLMGQAASLGDATVSAPVLADATAAVDGGIEVSWSVPAAPPAAVDAAPRGYAVVASGKSPTGATHTARLLAPVVAYPESGPCAAADAVSTS
ncbi:MAG: hypothetical protein OXG44_01675, partial [Gammaproteobacteria bacterium]|nr:hypothetical protein [Gammaproteobacteria bacterium]